MQGVPGSSPGVCISSTTMKKYELTLPNNETIETDANATYIDLLETFLPKEAKQAYAVKVGQNIFDLKRNVSSSGTLDILTFQSDAGKEVFWHSSAHALAQAIKRLYPKAQLTIGPVVKSGPGFFYYDIQLEEKITEENFSKIEDEIQKIKKENHSITRTVLTKEEAIQKFTAMGEHFKAQIINELPIEEDISVYTQGEFSDLCRGPHLPNTNKLGVTKITAISGAYWKGDSSQPMLQRIYAVSFPTDKELRQYLFQIEEAKKRDHRKIGKELELFYFDETAPGMPFYQPNGTILFNNLVTYIRHECSVRGYHEIKTPIMLSDELWIRSGHYENFKENMYFTEVEEHDFAIKPMNCPGASLLYRSQEHSYRDLPLKLAELGTVHRHELSGVLHGLFRVRAFTQDDAHIYCTQEQLANQIEETISFTLDVYKKFGFTDVSIFVATRPIKSLGSDEIWDMATNALTQSLTALSMPFKIKEGEGAFYGPKIEFNIKDCLERNWQCGTIQVDFSMPTRFNLEYKGADNKQHQPVMLHRAILGSLERFMGILIEHYEGKFPLWLSPNQISILTVNSAQDDYAKKLEKNLLMAGFRVRIDLRNEKIGYKVRDWVQKKENYALVLGKQEEETNTVALRSRGSQETINMTIEELIHKLKGELS